MLCYDSCCLCLYVTTCKQPKPLYTYTESEKTSGVLLNNLILKKTDLIVYMVKVFSILYI